MTKTVLRDLFPARVSPWYRVAWILLAVKAVSALEGVWFNVTRQSLGRPGYYLWAAGKVSPTLFCLCFFIDSVVMKRSGAMILFWGALSVVVPIFTWWIVYVRH